jgi:hypothetical protein
MKRPGGRQAGPLVDGDPNERLTPVVPKGFASRIAAGNRVRNRRAAISRGLSAKQQLKKPRRKAGAVNIVGDQYALRVLNGRYSIPRAGGRECELVHICFEAASAPLLGPGDQRWDELGEALR